MKEHINSLVQLCKEQPFNVEKIQAYILDNKLNSEEITRVAIELCEYGAFSYEDFMWFKSREPAPQELLTYNWEQLFDILIANGLDGNLVFCDDGINYENILQSVQNLDDNDLNARIARKLLEKGGDPNLLIGNERLFEEVDSNFTCDSLWGFYPEKRQADNDFRFWLVLMGFGGVMKGGKCPVNLRTGNTIEAFKEFERFNHRTVYIENEKEYEIQIFERNTGIIVATV